MIIVNETGDEIYLFNSTKEVESNLEAIDVENNEYEACDDDGFIYQFELVKSPSTFDPGQFKIVKTDEQNANLPKKYFMNYGKKFSKTDDELEELYRNSSCASEAMRTVNPKLSR
ncbi:MAG: hypothetical protein H6755_06315 [Candidatus Omnitrophica bacterium]|nr:hypothetical protein [Candidatus Omnitrophota bacterium]